MGSAPIGPDAVGSEWASRTLKLWDLSMVQVHLPWVGMALTLEAAHHAILRNLVSVLGGTVLLLSSVLGLLSDASLEGESVPPLQEQL